jgi:hypothetical protein
MAVVTNTESAEAPTPSGCRSRRRSLVRAVLATAALAAAAVTLSPAAAMLGRTVSVDNTGPTLAANPAVSVEGEVAAEGAPLFFSAGVNA